ncbi:MAG: transcription antitermination factor NusB [Roseinatronobacter sp.]
MTETVPRRRPSQEERRARKAAARFYAVQALFQMEASDVGVGEIIRQFETHRIGAEEGEESWVEADLGFFRRLIEATVDRQAAIDQMTDRALVAKWPISRIDPTLRALFRAAGAELVSSDTPARVVISQFVDLASAFFPEGREANFVNAVLDHMAREARAAEF